MYRLENPLRNYPWGSRTLIAGLLGREPGAEPEAEMWIGAHPSAPSRVVSGVPGETPGLDELISANAEALLGTEVAGDGRSLPFLLKLLAAEKPLSIQVHPDAAQAAEGFAAENAAGIALDAPHRNYRDAAHKPEMIYALTDFAALSGFREPEQIARHFSLLLPLLSGVAADACAGIIELLGGEDALRNTFGRLLCGAPELTELTARVLHAVRRPRNRCAPTPRWRNCRRWTRTTRTTRASWFRSCSTSSSWRRARPSTWPRATSTPTCAGSAWKSWRTRTTCCAAV